MDIDSKNVKIKRTFMRDEAYEILQEWIMTGKLKPGTQLRDQELSDMLGISRTPIREALLRLEDDGLIVTQANRWTLVAPINLEEAENIYSIVKVLETLALEQGIHNVTDEVLEELDAINEKFKEKLKQADKIAAFQADNEFHERIVRMSQNLELPRLLNTLKIKVQRMEIHYFSIVNNSFESYNEHKKIIDALKDRDLAQSIEAIKANWENSLSRIQQRNQV